MTTPIGPGDRPVDLSKPPESMTPARPQTAAEQAGQQQAPPNASPPPGAQPQYGPTPSFDFNQPTILSLLYISAFVFGITGLVAVILAYSWKDKPQADWEPSHYQYHIRTFWIWLIGFVAGIPLLLALGLGFLLWIAVAVLVLVRAILALIKAQERVPMPNPDTWLA